MVFNRADAMIWRVLVGAAGMTFINIGLVILLSAALKSSRHAVIVAIFFCFAFPILVSFEPRDDWLDLLNPVRPELYFPYAGIVDPLQEMLPQGLSIFGGMAQVVGVGVLVNMWLRKQEA